MYSLNRSIPNRLNDSLDKLANLFSLVFSKYINKDKTHRNYEVGGRDVKNTPKVCIREKKNKYGIHIFR